MNQNNNESIENAIPNVNSKEKEERNVPDLRYISECKLKDICFPITYGLAASAIPFDGIHKYIRITDIDENTGEYLADSLVSPAYFSNEYKVIKNDILFARTGASVGKTYIHTDIDNTYFAGFLMRIRLFDHNPYYIYQQFKTKHFKKWLAIMSMRSGQPGINSAELGNYTIKISSRKSEDKIAEIFKAIDNRIITQKKIINSKKSLIKSISQHFFMNAIPNVELKDIVTINKGKQVNGNLLNDTFTYSFFNGGSEASGKYNNHNAENCISISEGGNSCGYVNYVKEKFWSGGHNYTLIPTKEINLEYLYTFLKYKELELMSLRVGTGLPNIQKSSLYKFKVYIPDYNIQNRIALIFTKLRESIENGEKILKLYQKQKDYLLNKMFI